VRFKIKNEKKKIGQSTIHFYWPERKNCASKRNNCSLVFSLDFKQVQFLFTGDIEKVVENKLERIVRSQSMFRVLKVAHHGSRTSSSHSFLKKYKPTLAVISSGFRKPHHEVLSRFKQIKTRVYRTDLSGAVSIATDGTKLKIKTKVSF